MLRIQKILLALITVMLLTCLPNGLMFAAQACECPDCATPKATAEEEHAGHDHSAHSDKEAQVGPVPEIEDDHSDCSDDHQAEDKDAHAGHDHSAQSESQDHQVGPVFTESDTHEGHDDSEKADDPHAGHDHAAQAEPAESEDAHAGHGHDELISLDPDAKSLIDIRTIKAQSGSLSSTVRLTGKIGLNANKVAHIVPLTSGIVRQATANIGDQVKKDDILAWIESAELGKAKVQYLDIQAELGCCTMLLTRAQQINDNTLKLIDILKSTPSLDQLQEIGMLEMGDNRSILIKAYAEYIFAKSVYDREKPLYEQKISSKQEYLDAENRLKKARAEYNAALDTIQFKVKQDLLEAASTQQRQEIALKGAERTLYVLGQTEADIKALDLLALNPTASTASIPPCPDPNCDACKAKSLMMALPQPAPADFKHLGWYPLRAPFHGTVIDKHITLGERLDDDAAVFTVADLQSVWIDLAVFPKDLVSVKKGQVCQISYEGQSFEGEISFLSPILDPQTRTATARVVMDNTDGSLRPGLFVTAVVYGKSTTGDIIIPRQAVQLIEDKQCVFVDEGAGYELRPVKLGRGNVNYVEILSGLQQGEKIVTKGAFDLKAKIVTSTMDSHAGHGH